MSCKAEEGEKAEVAGGGGLRDGGALRTEDWLASWLTAAASGPDARSRAEPWPPVSVPGAGGQSQTWGEGACPGVLLLSFRDSVLIVEHSVFKIA